MTVYRIFDIAVACDFPLPGLFPLESESPDWQVKTESGAPGGNSWEWFHSWTSPDGMEIMACARMGDIYLLKINQLSYFLINFNQQRISVFPIGDCPGGTLAHLLVDQVIPRVLCHLGRMVVHASAVELSDGHAAAFTGLSGQGKSTLATAFFRSGYRPIADDCLLLENRDGKVYALASYPSLRLWPDSAAAMVNEEALEGAQYTEIAHYTNKRQLLFAADKNFPQPRWIPLVALFLLESIDRDANDQEIRVVSLGGMDSIMALISSSFALDVVSESCVRRNFEVVRAVVGGVRVKRLDYPRNYVVLPAVMSAIEEWVSETIQVASINS